MASSSAAPRSSPSFETLSSASRLLATYRTLVTPRKSCSGLASPLTDKRPLFI